MINRLLIILALASAAWGATRTAGSVNMDSVQAKIDASSDGDTVLIPAGSAIWRVRPAVTNDWEHSSICIRNKRLYIFGAHGYGTTVNIRTDASTFGAVIAIVNPYNKPFRISRINFYGDTSTAGEHNCVVLEKSDGATGALTGWRFDSLKFDFSGTTSSEGQHAISMGGLQYGCIDHCEFFLGHNTFVGVQITGSAGSETVPGDNEWSHLLRLGSDSAVYVEDCKFDGAQDYGMFLNDCQMGGRMVIRHCNIINGTAQMHGAHGSGRSGVKLEIYENRFAAGGASGAFRPAQIRGGSGVIYRNVVHGYSSNTWDVDVERACNAMGSYGKCDGTSANDGNVEAGGWPCMDQIGRTGGTLGSQTSAPYYAWSNGPDSSHYDGTIQITSIATCAESQARVKGTAHGNGDYDFINNGTTAMPEYTAYTYPHPLNTEGTPVSAKKCTITIVR